MRNGVRALTGTLVAALLLLGFGTAGPATASTGEPRSVTALANAFHPIKNVGTGKCLQPQGGSPAVRTLIVPESCNGSAAQGWLEQRVGNHHYWFINQGTGSCLDVDDGIGNGAPVRLGICRAISDQEFNTDVDLPGVSVVLESRLDFRDNDVCVTSEDVARLRACNPLSPAQHWTIGLDV